VLTFSRAENSTSLELLHNVIALMGCETELVYNAARQNRRLRLLQDGQVDVITEASDLPERRDFAWISAPYRVERTGIYILNEKPGLDRFLTLEKILAQRLRTYLPTGWHGEHFNEWRETMRQQKLGIEYDSSTEVIRDLGLKRVDVIIGIDYPAAGDWSQSPDIVRSGDWIYEDPVSFLLSKKRFDAAWVERFNQVLIKTLKK
jgi:ABC-type amino acid transport substrate-binding protein